MRRKAGTLSRVYVKAGLRRLGRRGLNASLAVLLVALGSLVSPVVVGAQSGNALPEAPGPVSAIPLTTQQVYLSWTPAAGAPPAGYVVTRDGRDLTSVPPGTLGYTDTLALQASTNYIYSVSAVDATGNRSRPSPAVRAKTPAAPETPDTNPPTPPENLEAAEAAGKVTLAWEDSTDETGIGGYLVRRDGRPIATLDPGTRVFVDTSIRPSTSYTYVVEAIDVVGHHSQPSQVTVSTGQFSQVGPARQGAPSSAATTSVPAASLAAGYNAALRRYPYLTDLVQGYATINWATDDSGTAGSIRYGKAGSEACTAHALTATKTNIIVNSVVEYQWKAMLTLTPGTQYCYRVYLGSTDLLGSHAAPKFWTQVPAGSTQPFSFAVFGDWAAVDGTGSNPNQASLMSQLAASGARFALTVGDNVYASGSQTEYGDLVQTGPSISAVFGPQYWANVGASMAIFPAMGNHGMARSDTIHPHLQNWPQDRAVSTSGGRYQIDTYCCINGTTSGNYPSTWYAFDAGISRFYVLEAAWPDGNVGASSAYANDYGYHWTATSAEYQWLRNDLAKHPSQLKFVTFHYPLYSDNVHEASDTYLQGANSLEGLLNQYGVDIIFDGHAHNYQRFRPRNAGGVISYLSGGGGAQLTPINTCSSFDEYAIGWSYASSKGSACHAPLPSTASQVFHYLLVTVNGATVTVTPTNAQGQTFDVKTYSFGQVYRYRTLLPIVASSPGTIVSPFSPAKALDLPTATFGAGSNMPTPAPGLAPTPTLMPPATDTPAPTVTDTPPPTATPSLTWSATSTPTPAPVATFTLTPTAAAVPTGTLAAVPTLTLTATPTAASISTTTATASLTPTVTLTPTPMATLTLTATSAVMPALTPTASAPPLVADGLESGSLAP